MKKIKSAKQLTPTEEALLQSEERYKAFISQSTEGIWRCELEKPLSMKDPIKKQLAHIFKYGYLAECNDAMAQMYGYKKAAELKNIRLKDIMVPTDEENSNYLTDFIKSNFKLQKRRSHERDKYGNSHIFENNLIGIIENGYVLRAWGTQRDITEQIKANERQEFWKK
ncbi:MAG: PAS domain S-box protein [Candidatus Levybacteria bacterium]|nr:PAS domain S-box protein [Candidatus Levybacteria bacterium]